MKEIIIGLSGHIDHGKTSIIKALSQDFSGSLKEDHKRGMTVDLGIAFFNEKITLIDVPGHEDFIKNMMSGVHSIDIGMLVIAADDGVMPQTIEHINILSLLEIKKLIIIINKIDLADKDIIEIIKLEIYDLIEKTNFKDYDIVETSTISNEGIDKLKKLIINNSQSVVKKEDKGIFRMPIDRFFSIKGFGSVVTGTVLSGKTKIGDDLMVQPINLPIKVRGINSHNKTIKEIGIGQRAAINIQNIEIDKLKRGFQLVTKEYYKPIKSVIAKIKILNIENFFIKKNQRLRFHIGTNEIIGKIHLFNEKKIINNQSSIVLINFEKPVIACYKDKFIIRHYSPQYTLGGGEIILQSEYKNYGKMKLSKINDVVIKLRNINDSDYIETILELNDLNPILKTDFLQKLGYDDKFLSNVLKGNSSIVKIDFNNKNWLATKKQLEIIKKNIIEYIKIYLNENIYETNVNKKIISNHLMINIDFLDWVLNSMMIENLIVKKEAGWSILNHNNKLSSDNEKLKSNILRILNEEIFNTSSIDELSDKFNINDKKLILKILKLCESDGLIVRINQNIFITIENINLLKNKITVFFEKNDSLNVSDFKKIINSSRKYAIPILEYFDKIKFTSRYDNERKLNR